MPYKPQVEVLVDQVKAKQDLLTAAQIERLLAVIVNQTRGAFYVTVTIMPKAEENTPGDQSSERADQSRLSPEQMKELLTALEDRFNNHPVHYKNLAHLPRRAQNVIFEEVRSCLENDPVLAGQVYAMHARGGEPDVWSRAGQSFLFFESIQDTSPASRNCVYGRAQAEWLRHNRTNEPFGGSVEEQRADMGGVGVVSKEMWELMRSLGSFTDNSYEWVDSDSDNYNAPAGRAQFAGLDFWQQTVRVQNDYASNYRSERGWRAVAQGLET